MGAQGNLAPVIIKKKKVSGGGGHHGGAWKVAYADFVTAMMAFFLLMWLLNATTEQQRSGLADYFRPTIAVNRVSGGGDGMFGGDDITSENTLSRQGTGGIGNEESRDAEADEALQQTEEMLLGMGGESAHMEELMKHVKTRITDEGLVIELFALDGAPLFDEGGNEPTELMRELVALVASVSRMVINDIAVEGHVRAQPITLRSNTVWELSERRATQVRHMLESLGTEAGRMNRVTGHADREPALANPMAERNDRIEVILLRG
ncbi:flagellar motor protein MotB [Sulfitobacter sp. LCG007]